MIVYRYAKRKYNLALLRRGSCRVGTLHGYRDEEGHPYPIGDAGEGTGVVRFSNDEWNSDDSSERAERTRRAHEFMGLEFDLPPGSDFTIIGGDHERHQNLPDSYVACFSLERSALLMQRLGYDSCVEIINIEQFAARLRDALRRKVKIQVALGCAMSYEARERTWAEEEQLTNAARIKLPDLAWQKEYRIYFVPGAVAEKVIPLSVVEPRLTSLCRQIW